MSDAEVTFASLDETFIEMFIQAAKTAVRRASLIAVRVREHLHDVDKAAKNDASPVTVGDYSCQIVVIDTLRTLLYNNTQQSSTSSSSLLSTFRMVGEEDAQSLQEISSTIQDHILQTLNTSFTRSLLVNNNNTNTSSSSSSSSTSFWTHDHIYQTLSLAGYHGGGKDSYWILDPIDGTKGYLRGGQYAVGLAYVMHGEVVLSIIGCPSLPYPTWNTPNTESSATGCLFTAIKGKGATMEPLQLDRINTSASLTLNTHDTNSSSTLIQPLKTSTEENTAKLILAESFDKNHSNHELSAHISKQIGLITSPIQLDSMCKYGLLARGDVHMYLRFPPKNYNEKVWDHAPGSLLCTEAGGVVTDCYGKPLDFSIGRSLSNNYGIVAANNKVVHDKIMEAIRSYVN